MANEYQYRQIFFGNSGPFALTLLRSEFGIAIQY